MPVVSQKQRNLMQMVAHNPGEARRLGFHVPQKVAKEYLKATPNLKNKALPVRRGGRGR